MIVLFYYKSDMKKSLVILSFLINTIYLFTQTGSLNFDLDHCVFYGSDKPVYELYYSFYLSDLKINALGDKYEVAGMLEIEIINSANKKIFEKKYKVPYLIDDTLNYDRSRKLTGQINLSLEAADEYILNITSRDFYNQANSLRISDTLKLEAQYSNKINMSDIQLCEYIEKSQDTDLPFYKSGLEVFPNPSRFYDEAKTQIAYYFEIYGLRNLNSEFYKLRIKLLSGDSIIKSFEADYMIKSDSKAEYGKLNISGLMSGRYRLSVELINSSGEMQISRGNYFWIYNKKDFITKADGFELSEYSTMSEDLVNKELIFIEYLLSDKLKVIIKSLKDIRERRSFLYEFWKEVESSQPGFKSEYFARINYANKNFTSKFEEGWRSDRGRVYCKYGKPDEIERYDFESKTLPHEIWKYNLIQNGIYFVFADLSGGGDNYRLIHSTALGEVNNEEWKRRITR